MRKTIPLTEVRMRFQHVIIIQNHMIYNGELYLPNATTEMEKKDSFNINIIMQFLLYHI